MGHRPSTDLSSVISPKAHKKDATSIALAPGSEGS